MTMTIMTTPTTTMTKKKATGTWVVSVAAAVYVVVCVVVLQLELVVRPSEAFTVNSFSVSFSKVVSSSSSSQTRSQQQQRQLSSLTTTSSTYLSSFMLFASSNDDDDESNSIETTKQPSNIDRRQGIKRMTTFVGMTLVATNTNIMTTGGRDANAAEFAPGGTLVEYEVGVTAGNSQASKSRKVDNSNVVFSQDSYYKFGRAQPFIRSGSTEFPKTIPFTRITQRYEAYKKYKDRVQRGIDLVVDLKNVVDSPDYKTILDGTAPEYSIRPMGLLANGFLASENTGTTNELLLARWYINEVALDVTDIKTASSQDDARKSYDAAMAALNSYIGLMNRCITDKVGEPFKLIL
jgi:hypothetical protein